MGIDYGETERQFLAGLKAETGRDAAEWMAEIGAQNLTHRNDIIDWLRRQGFMFSKASWLERIYHNGGKPVYGDRKDRVRGQQGKRDAGAKPAAVSVAAPEPVAEAAPVVMPPPPPPPPSRDEPAAKMVAPAAPPPAPAPREAVQSSVSTSHGDMAGLLTKAKAYRPLAQFVIAEVGKAVPGSSPAARDGFVVFERDGRVFAALTIGARDLKLCVAPREAAGAQLFELQKPLALPGFPAALSSAITLTDARQITAALLSEVRQAADRSS